MYHLQYAVLGYLGYRTYALSRLPDCPQAEMDDDDATGNASKNSEKSFTVDHSKKSQSTDHSNGSSEGHSNGSQISMIVDHSNGSQISMSVDHSNGSPIVDHSNGSPIVDHSNGSPISMIVGSPNLGEDAGKSEEAHTCLLWPDVEESMRTAISYASAKAPTDEQDDDGNAAKNITVDRSKESQSTDHSKRAREGHSDESPISMIVGHSNGSQISVIVDHSNGSPISMIVDPPNLGEDATESEEVHTCLLLPDVEESMRTAISYASAGDPADEQEIPAGSSSFRMAPGLDIAQSVPSLVPNRSSERTYRRQLPLTDQLWTPTRKKLVRRGKRTKNPFLAFKNANWWHVRAQMPELQRWHEIMQEVVRRWHELPLEAKEVYKMASSLKDRRAGGKKTRNGQSDEGGDRMKQERRFGPFEWLK